MFATLIAAAAASSLTPTLEATARRINVNGVRATYTRTVDSDGTVHLRGVYEENQRAPFHFRVRGGKVKGEVDGFAMTFKRPSPR